MRLFSNKAGKLERVKESRSTEKPIQKVTESNLGEIFGLELVKSEFPIGSLRIDTLAFDPEARSFVIIEYKRDKNSSVVDQGYAYLALLLNNKADFLLEYNENKNPPLKRDSVDWSQSKVIFLSPEFTKYQKQAINFRDLPLELWEVKQFENGLLAFDKLESPETSESISKISGKSEVVQKVSKEIKVYSEEDHLAGKPEEVKMLYEDLKQQVLSLGAGIEVRPKKLYIAFVARANFTEFVIQQSRIRLYVDAKLGELDDSRKLARDVSNKGHWGTGNYEVDVAPNDDVEYVVTLIRQSFVKHGK